MTALTMRTGQRNGPYVWLPALIVMMMVVALVFLARGFYSFQANVIATTGESLALAASDIAEMVDRVLFERYSDVLIAAKAAAFQQRDRRTMTEQLVSLKKIYPAYLWLGVTDSTGQIIASTDATRDGDVIADSLLRQEGQVNLKLLGLPSALFTGSAQSGYVEEMHLRRHVRVVSGYAQTRGYGDFLGFHWGILVRLDRDTILASL